MITTRFCLAVVQAFFIAGSFAAISAATSSGAGPGAQVIRYSIPPLRGDIYVTNSIEHKLEPIASSNPHFKDFVKDAPYFAIDFTRVMNSNQREVVLSFVRNALSWINNQIDVLNRAREASGVPLLNKENLPDNVIWGYFETRRWIPLRVSSVLLEDEAKTLEVPEGITLVYRNVRSYPKEVLASNIIGRFSPSSVSDWKRSGFIQESDFLFPRQKAGVINGKNHGTGLEHSLGDILDSGTPKVMEKAFDANGKVLKESVIKPGTSGNAVLLTLDYHMQKIAEQLVQDKYQKTVKKKLERVSSNAIGLPKGFVLIDLRDMSIAAMASSPPIDLKRLSPGYGENDSYTDEAEASKLEPFNSRAFENSYPPASTFKLITAMAALDTGFINSQTLYSCPESVAIQEGDAPNTHIRYYKNHVNEEKELNLDSIPNYNFSDAIKRSCNTWFYQMAIAMVKANPRNLQKLFDIANLLGFGQAPAIPLPGLGKGAIYKSADGYTDKNGVSHVFNDGDIANLAIGQGETEATPLQVAWMTSQIAMPTNTQKLKLVSGIYEGPQRKYVDYDTFTGTKGKGSVRPLISLVKPSTVELIHQAMWSVANDEMGTATRVNSGLDYKPQVAAKTGTGQWKSTHVAWLTGFFPYARPLYAFAFFVEGKKGIELSGGKSVAPFVNAFLSDPIVKAKIHEYLGVSADAPAPVEIRTTERVIPRAQPVIPRAEPVFPRAQPVRPVPEPTPGAQENPPVDQPNRPRKSMFNRIFGDTPNDN